MNAQQLPISSPFGAASTAAQVLEGIDLSGRLAIVTGASSGIGLETARALAAAGARVICPVRDRAKAMAALEGIEGVTIETLDLGAPASIDAFADKIVAQGEPVHILINNAGYIGHVLKRDARGYEAQFATNHLGHFQLTARLWPVLVKDGARVVSVSSCGHAASPVVFDDIHFNQRPYDPMTAYGQSKSANALFALWLDRLGAPAGVRAYSLHPGGMIESGFAREMSEAAKQASGYLDAEGRPIVDPENNKKSLQQGAATQVWCATSPLLEGLGGIYCENCNIAEPAPADSTALLGARPWILDEAQAERLWTLSAEMTGVDLR